MSSSFSYERYDRRSSRNRGTFTYWVPLAVTVTLAAGGIAAWIWSARSDHESSSSSDDENLSYGEETVERSAAAEGPRPPSYGVSEGVVREEDRSEYRETSEAREETTRGESSAQEGTFLGRVQGAIRRTPSPQQVFDYAGKRVAAGVAAAGVAVGGALSAIREEDNHYEDHERWNEEAELKKDVTATGAESSSAVATNTEAFATSAREGPSAATASRAIPTPTGKRKTVAVVVSGESVHGGLDEEEQSGYATENATLLSHLPPINPATTNFLILIYNPNGRPPSSLTGDNKPSSLGSSYAALPTPLQTPGEELQSMDPHPYTPSNQTPALSARDSHSELYDLLYKQSVTLVEKPANVLTFTTASGYIHMLKHIAPDTVYIVDSLAGERGSNIDAIRGWVGQVVVVVGGDGSGLGGLIDTEDEGDGSGKAKSRDKWWESSDMVGLGKGVEVVDGVRFAEDWERRVGGKE